MEKIGDDPLVLPIKDLVRLVQKEPSLCELLSGALIHRPSQKALLITHVVPRGDNPQFNVLVDGISIAFNPKSLGTEAFLTVEDQQFRNAHERGLEAERLRVKGRIQKAEKERQERVRIEKEQAESKEEFARLQSQWGINGLADSSPSNPLFGILKRRDAGEQLRKQDIDIARKQGQYKFAADWYRDQYQQSGKPGSLAALGSDLRHCGNSRETVDFLSQEVLSQGIKDASVFTTLGAALADEGKLQDAEKWALKALNLEVTFYPHNLLGRVYFRTGDPKRGEGHFNFAIELGANVINLRRTMESAIEESEVAQQKRNAAYLLDVDPVKYGWAKRHI